MLIPLLLLSVSTASPDSLPGTWRITGDVAGNPVNEICTIKQEGTALSGSCTMPGGRPYEVTGEAKDGRFTFRHDGVYDGGVITLIYSGVLGTPGEMKGSIQVQPFDVSGEFIAVPAPVTS